MLSLIHYLSLSTCVLIPITIPKYPSADLLRMRTSHHAHFFHDCGLTSPSPAGPDQAIAMIRTPKPCKLHPAHHRQPPLSAKHSCLRQVGHQHTSHREDPWQGQHQEGLANTNMNFPYMKDNGGLLLRVRGNPLLPSSPSLILLSPILPSPPSLLELDPMREISQLALLLALVR